MQEFKNSVMLKGRVFKKGRQNMDTSVELTTIDRFLRYVQIDTQSDEESVTSPSTMKQHNLAALLEEELTLMGAEDICYDKEHCYVYATIPATPGMEDKPVMGLIAHMDTSPAVSGADVHPCLITEYDGRDIVLNREQNIVMRTKDFPNLKKHSGKDLIVTDGTTLLGADDKAGVAEIMAMADFLLSHPEKQHGKIRIGFTPDEEIGSGSDYFDVEKFGADYAYTVDGGPLGELEYENFNAAGVKLVVHGRSVHPGEAKGKMKNAILLAQEFQSLLPVEQNPMYTEGYEGFFHLDSIRGNVEEVVCDYIIRDHDRHLFEKKKQVFLECVQFMNARYGENTLVADMKDSYYNMREIIEKHMELVERVKETMAELEITPCIQPIRGGTDGAKLSYMGLPCPNLCTGGENYHGRYEFACVQSMEKITELLIRLAEK